MINQESLVPKLIAVRGHQALDNFAALGAGLLLLIGLAQVSIPLPFTPVPITGQTFGVALISLLWGRNRGISIVGSYLMLGFLGLPVFAQGKSGLLLGPTSGYLLGMFVAAFVMGTFADRGWTRSFARTWMIAALGSLITFSFGVFGLSFFLPHSSLLSAGVLPFLPGDFIKTILVCGLVQGLQNGKRPQS